MNTDDKQGLSISELFLLPDQVRDGLLRAILLESIPVSLIGKNAVRHRGLLSAVLLRFELGSTGCYLAATCHTNLERVLDELRQLRTLHALILIAVGQGIYGLDGNGEVTQGNATTLDTFAG